MLQNQYCLPHTPSHQWGRGSIKCPRSPSPLRAEESMRFIVKSRERAAEVKWMDSGLSGCGWVQWIIAEDCGRHRRRILAEHKRAWARARARAKYTQVHQSTCINVLHEHTQIQIATCIYHKSSAKLDIHNHNHQGLFIYSYNLERISFILSTSPYCGDGDTWLPCHHAIGCFQEANGQWVRSENAVSQTWAAKTVKGRKEAALG